MKWCNFQQVNYYKGLENSNEKMNYVPPPLPDPPVFY